MQLHVINPNTTAAMTETIAVAARRVAGPGTRIVATQPASGPVSIESHFDEAVAAVGVLEQVRAGARERADGYVVGVVDSDGGVFDVVAVSYADGVLTWTYDEPSTGYTVTYVTTGISQDQGGGSANVSAKNISLLIKPFSSGTPAMAAASVVSAHRSSGSRLCTWFLPPARAMVWASSVMTFR